MIVDTSYQDNCPFLFAGNSGVIKINEISGNLLVQITHLVRDNSMSYDDYVNGAVNFTTSYEIANSGDITLNLSEIFIAMHFSPVSEYLFRFGLTKFPSAVRLKLSDNNDAFEYEWGIFRGEVDSSTLPRIYCGQSFITSRPQIYRASDSDSLMFYGAPNKLTYIKAKCYWPYGPPIVITLRSLSGGDIEKIECGIIIIKYYLQQVNSYASDNIQSYDIYATYIDDNGVDVVSEPLRYIIDDRHYSEFKFIGQRGSFERIYAQPLEKTKFDFDSDKFVNSDIEQEVSINGYLVHESYSGYIANHDVSRFWIEFISSNNKFIIKDGREHSVIFEGVEAERMEKELSSLSFKWHYANRLDNPDMLIERKELLEYKI